MTWWGSVTILVIVRQFNFRSLCVHRIEEEVTYPVLPVEKPVPVSRVDQAWKP